MSREPRIQRRAFLRGTGGVVLGIPWLEVFAPRKAKALAESVPKFFVFMHQANGVAQASMTEAERFWPRQLGAISRESLASERDRAVSELSSYADKLLMVRGLHYSFDDLPCTHVSAYSQMLTATAPYTDKVSNQISATGESLDYRLARELHPDREPLTLLAPANASMAPTLSYRGPQQPRSMESNPWTVYKRMSGLVNADEAIVALVAQRRKSVNDLVRTQLQALLARTDLGREDRRRLDLHLSSVRDVEVKLTCNLGKLSADELGESEINDPRNLLTIAKLHMDLIALSCACDYSRVATLSVGGCGNAGKFELPNNLDADVYTYHQISHRVVVTDVMTAIERGQDMHHEIDRIHAQLFLYLLDKLGSYRAGEKTLLDQGVAIWANELGDGPDHSRKNLPWIIAGSAGGYLQQGSYLDAGDIAHNKLLNTILNAFGVRKPDGSEVDDFGDSSLQKGQLDLVLARS